ncbi:SYF2-domain-containing protein [Annulohypoxylon truncatum]|uniref:SYF2-domain-containing protein n=1 Tax=Annulohypoxylon truncatum TaxID=327061 RepID=UPI0020074BD6|nr:SYF2-domain-containing protein [Annulohypoxylon truncatum]KAI1212999.1 SYF2-domain-containing protein [Annulohypoxylon truncatum]
MPPAKKRKTAKGAKATKATAHVEDASASAAATEEIVEQTPSVNDEMSQEQQPAEKPSEAMPAEEPTPTETATETEEKAASSASDAADKAKDRMARFRALQARAKSSSDQNLAEATKESQRLATDPSALVALNRRRDIASHKLLKAETEEAGDDFERKRAWDWTAEESERWDRRVKKKAAHRDNNAFQDYRQESNKVYKRQVRDLLAAPNLERYERDKMAAIERAAASGGLDIVETEDGELIAVDRDGSFYSTADSTAFAENRPDKAAVDRLVGDLQKAEEQRLRKRRERMAQNGDEGDVTYINEKNKQFNQKLSRFYNKYTAEIRDSFERGTMI